MDRSRYAAGAVQPSVAGTSDRRLVNSRRGAGGLLTASDIAHPERRGALLAIVAVPRLIAATTGRCVVGRRRPCAPAEARTTATSSVGGVRWRARAQLRGEHVVPRAVLSALPRYGPPTTSCGSRRLVGPRAPPPRPRRPRASRAASAPPGAPSPPARCAPSRPAAAPPASRPRPFC